MGNRRTEIMQWLSDVLKSNMQGLPYKAFIFGSQANKKELTRSDIDLGIVSDSTIPSEYLVRVNSAIEDLPMLYKVDIVDFSIVDDNFRAVASKNIEWL